MQRPCSHKGLSNQEQLEAVKEEVKNAEVVMATLNGLPGSWDSCQKEVINFSKLWEKEEARFIRREGKMEETEDQALTIKRRYLKAMRNMKI